MKKQRLTNTLREIVIEKMELKLFDKRIDKARKKITAKGRAEKYYRALFTPAEERKMRSFPDYFFEFRSNFHVSSEDREISDEGSRRGRSGWTIQPSNKLPFPHRQSPGSYHINDISDVKGCRLSSEKKKKLKIFFKELNDDVVALNKIIVERKEFRNKMFGVLASYRNVQDVQGQFPEAHKILAEHLKTLIPDTQLPAILVPEVQNLIKMLEKKAK